MKRVLVTGGEGFVGNSLVARLISNGADVTVLRRSAREVEHRPSPPGPHICTLEQLEAEETFEFDSVFHLATHYVFEHSHEDCSSLVASNVELIMRVGDLAMRSVQSVSLVNVSTFMQHHEGLPYQPTCLYAATKQAAEVILQYFSLAPNMTVKTLVFPHIYGENDQRPKLLNLLIRCAKTSTEMELASGQQVMDLVHVDDAVEALMYVALRPSGRWSISSGQVIKIRDLVSLIERHSGKTLNVRYNANKDRALDQYHLWHSAEPLPGWAPKVELENWLAQVFPLTKGENQ